MIDESAPKTPSLNLGELGSHDTIIDFAIIQKCKFRIIEWNVGFGNCYYIQLINHSGGIEASERIYSFSDADLDKALNNIAKIAVKYKENMEQMTRAIPTQIDYEEFGY